MRLIGKLVSWLGVLATPLAGFWIASSLAAMHNAPLWAVVLAGAVMFPLGSVGWEAFALWRTRGRRGTRSLGLGDRLLARTLSLDFLLPASQASDLVRIMPRLRCPEPSGHGIGQLDRVGLDLPRRRSILCTSCS
jgi:hypothetical protein